MARPETLRQFLIMPPEEEPIFRFGSSLIADQATVWLDGTSLVWMRQWSQRSLSLYHVRSVSAHSAVLLGQPVRHLSIVPLMLGERAAIAPSLTFQDRCGALLEEIEPDFEAFAAHFLARLKRCRPFLAIDGDEAVLLARKEC